MSAKDTGKVTGEGPERGRRVKETRQGSARAVGQVRRQGPAQRADADLRPPPVHRRDRRRPGGVAGPVPDGRSAVSPRATRAFRLEQRDHIYMFGRTRRCEFRVNDGRRVARARVVRTPRRRRLRQRSGVGQWRAGEQHARQGVPVVRRRSDPDRPRQAAAVRSVRSRPVATRSGRGAARCRAARPPSASRRTARPSHSRHVRCRSTTRTHSVEPPSRSSSRRPRAAARPPTYRSELHPRSRASWPPRTAAADRSPSVGARADRGELGEVQRVPLRDRDRGGVDPRGLCRHRRILARRLKPVGAGGGDRPRGAPRPRRPTTGRSPGRAASIARRSRARAARGDGRRRDRSRASCRSAIRRSVTPSARRSRARRARSPASRCPRARPPTRPGSARARRTPWCRRTNRPARSCRDAARRAYEAEIQQRHPPILTEEDVRRLDVAVHEAEAVDVIQRGAEVFRDVGDVVKAARGRQADRRSRRVRAGASRGADVRRHRRQVLRAAAPMLRLKQTLGAPPPQENRSRRRRSVRRAAPAPSRACRSTCRGRPVGRRPGATSARGRRSRA